MYSDDDMIMISALQHYVFCPRQCALIHVEQNWSENYLTASGRAMHDRVDTAGHQTRGDFYTATAVRLMSKELGLIGVTDMLEFHQVAEPYDSDGRIIAARLKRQSLYWIPFPIEYKHGKPKEHRADEIQLCAQALCLEEMLSVNIFRGALFYGKTRRRMDVDFDEDLRNKTIGVAHNVHALIKHGITPPAVYGKWCESCSLIDECRPKQLGDNRSVKKWMEARIENALK